jgi:prepilin-type N-terminal cleavage/methylation domain-containing protein
MQSPLETNCHDHIPTGVFHLRLGDGRRRRGFTLLELMLVLAVIVVVTAMAVPALYRPLQNYKLKKGADHVRAIMGKAQLRAIKSGQVQVMLFLPGSGDLLVQTHATDQDIIEFSPQSVAGM